jgi:hypothetical protein
MNGRVWTADVSFRVCINCFSIRVYPYMGFMVGQRYQCQDCLELMVLPLEFDSQDDYSSFMEQQNLQPKNASEDE